MYICYINIHQYINIRIMQSYVENNCIKYFLLKDIIYAYIIKHTKHKQN